MIAAMSYMSALFVNMYDNLYYMFEAEIKFLSAGPYLASWARPALWLAETAKGAREVESWTRQDCRE
ncbi:hypothetical protein AKG12_11600 [Agrobacterium sp. SUL3]|nr:hypothetical protein AKG12_11600 [Agrobacterium sp. SUL3]